MSKRQKFRSKFSKKWENGYLSQSPSRAPSTRPEGQWYRGTREIPLYKFIKLACDGNLSELIISGRPDPVVLLSTWNTMFEEFIDGMQSGKGKDRVKMLSELEKLQWDYNLIQLCVQRLKWGPAKWIVDILRQHVRVTGEFNPENMAQYFQDLQVVLNRSNTIQQKIIEKEAALKITEDRNVETGPPSYKQFDTLIAQVSIFAKFHINRLTIMTGEFMELYKLMRAHEDALTAQLEGTKVKKHGKG